MSKPVLAIRTVEFPLILTNQQRQDLEEICEDLKTVWNIALKRILEFDEKTGYWSKDAKAYNYCCPINYHYRNYWLDKDGRITDKKNGKERITVPFSKLIVDETVKPFGKLTPYLSELKTPKLYSGAVGNEKILEKVLEPNAVVTTSELSNIQGVIPDEYGCSGFSCPIYPTSEVTRNITPIAIESWVLYEAPLLSQANAYGLSKAINNGNLDYHPLREELKAIPYDYRVGVTNGLAVSWGEYDKCRKGQATHGLTRGKPRFKRKSDKIRTVIYGKSPKNTGKQNPDGDPLKDKIRPSGNYDDVLKGIPKLKEVKVEGLETRWRDHYGNYPRMTNMRFVERPYGWTIQLTGYFWVNPKLRESKGAIAADIGLQDAVIFDNGKSIPNPRFLRSRKERITQVQQRISNKKLEKLILWLNHPDRTVSDVKQLISVKAETAEQLLSCKSEKAGKELIGQSRWERLKDKVCDGSKQIESLEKTLRYQHYKIAQARKAFWNRLSTWLVRNYEIFACEDGLQREGVRHQAEAKYENGEAQSNQKKAKAGLNLSLSDLAPGMFMSQCEQKYKDYRDKSSFIRYPAKDTTKKCPVCDRKNDMGSNYPGQLYHCSNCGYEENRDQKAAIYIAVQLWEKGKIPFDLLSKPSQDAVLARLNWQEQNKPKRKTKKKSRAKG